MSITKDNELMTAHEVAKLLGVSDSHVYQMSKGKVKGQATLPHIKKGKQIIYDKKEINEYAIEHNYLAKLPVVALKQTAKIRTRLISRSDKIQLLSKSIPKRVLDHIIKRQQCDLKINDNGTGILNSRQSRNGKHCFVSQEVIDKGIEYLNDGYEINHRFIDSDGEVTYEEDLLVTVQRLRDLGFSAIKGKHGPYYIATLYGYWLDPENTNRRATR